LAFDLEPPLRETVIVVVQVEQRTCRDENAWIC